MSQRIDAHLHFAGDSPDALAMLDELDVRLLNICVAAKELGEWRQSDEALFRDLAEKDPKHYNWVTSFDLPDFSPDYADRCIAQLERDFAAGAVGCKIWKNIGMEVKKPSGEYIMPDDPILDPIYDYLEKNDHTLLAHLAEPYACWQPLDENNAHYPYYSKWPQWHMYNKPEYPSHESIMKARDRVLERHPRLRFVGAHFASLEYDLKEMAWRFDKFPNFAVDTSARLYDLTFFETSEVKAFFEKYHDRILFGTDIVHRKRTSTMHPEEREKLFAWMREEFQNYYDYLETDGLVKIRKKTVKGIGLTGKKRDNVMRENARRWYPGLQ